MCFYSSLFHVFNVTWPHLLTLNKQDILFNFVCALVNHSLIVFLVSFSAALSLWILVMPKGLENWFWVKKGLLLMPYFIWQWKKNQCFFLLSGDTFRNPYRWHKGQTLCSSGEAEKKILVNKDKSEGGQGQPPSPGGGDRCQKMTHVANS